MPASCSPRCPWAWQPGVGLFLLAGFATLVILVVLWTIESLQAEERKLFNLKVTTKDGEHLRTRLETLLQQLDVRYELRTASAEEICYEVKLPWGTRTDRVSNAIQRLNHGGTIAVEWEEKKNKT